MLTCPKQSFMGETSVTARSRNNYVWVNGNVSHVPPWIPLILNVDTWCLTRIAPSAKYPATIVRAGTSTMSCKKHKVGFKLLCSESTCPLFDVYVPITKPHLSSSFSYLRRVQDLNYHWILLTNYVDRNPDPHAIHWFVIIFPMKNAIFCGPNRTCPCSALLRAQIAGQECHVQRRGARGGGERHRHLWGRPWSWLGWVPHGTTISRENPKLRIFCVGSMQKELGFNWFSHQELGFNHWPLKIGMITSPNTLSIAVG